MGLVGFGLSDNGLLVISTSLYTQENNEFTESFFDTLNEYSFDVEKSSFEFFEDKKMIGFWGKKKIYQSEYKLFLSSNCEHFNCVLKYSLNYKKISIDEFLTYETNWQNIFFDTERGAI